MASCTDTYSGFELEVKKVEWLHQSFVSEWPEIVKILESLTPESGEYPFIRFQLILEKYQEQPKLLDGHICEVVVSITKKIVATADTSLFTTFFDSNITPYVPKILFIQKLFSLLYVLSRVRGYKAILKYFPHEVARLEQVELLVRLFSIPKVILLQEQVVQPSETPVSTVTSQGENGQLLNFADLSLFQTEAWHAEYIGCFWLSVVVLAPFNLTVIDSTAANGFIGSRIREWCQSGISERYQQISPSLIACSVLLSKLLSRPDMREELGQYIRWSLHLLDTPSTDQFDLHQTLTRSGNILTSLSSVMKHGNRKEILVYSNELEQLVEITEQLAKKGGASHRKTATKLSGRIGIVFLPPKMNRAWHYQRKTKSLLNMNEKRIIGKTSLSLPKEEEEEEEEDISCGELIEQIVGILLQGIRDADTKVRYSAAKRISYLAARIPRDFADQLVEFILELFSPLEEDGAWHGGCLALAEMSRRGVLTAEHLPDVLEVLKKAFLYDEKRGSSSRGSHIRDAACYVAWAFARAYDPETLEPFIGDLSHCLVIMCLFDREVNCRRAAAAAFQEIVGRQGGVGCCNMPHGIDIITIADYFSLGNRRDSYLKIAPQIASFEEYQLLILDHLLTKKVCHWDIHIRQLATQSLNSIKGAESFMVETALPVLIENSLTTKLHVRHGSILGVAEIIRSLAAARHPIPESIQHDILLIIQTIDMNRLFRGRGGSIIRAAVCHLIEAVSYSRFRLPASLTPKENPGDYPAIQKKPKGIKSLLQEMITEHLKNPQEEIQFAAARCLRQFSIRYHAVRTPQSCEYIGKIVDFYMKKVIQDPNPAARRGYALALGAISSSVMRLRLEPIVDTLIKATQLEVDKNWRDAETRRNALESLTELCEKLARTDLGIDFTIIQRIFSCMINALNDYSIDNRGDVGSWVRESAILCLAKLSLLLSRTKGIEDDKEKVWFTKENGSILFPALVKQSVEKIDRIRLIASSVISYLLYSNNAELLKKAKAIQHLRSKQKISRDMNYAVDEDFTWTPIVVPHIPHRETFLEIIPVDAVVQVHVWNGAHRIFKLFMPLLDFDIYRVPFLTGICLSVGGLSKHVATKSSENMIAYATRMKQKPETLKEFACNFLTIQNENMQENFITPYLKTIYVLQSNQILDTLQPPENNFSYEVVMFIRSIMKRTSDIRRLMEIIPLLVGFMPFNKPTQPLVMKLLLNLLSHKFPKVRQMAAEQFYVALITYGDHVTALASTGARSSFISLLSSTAWEKENLEILRPLVHSLSELLNV